MSTDWTLPEDEAVRQCHANSPLMSMSHITSGKAMAQTTSNCPRQEQSQACDHTWKGLYKQAAHNDEHMPEAHVWLPVALQHIHADLARLGNIGMEDLGQEVACIKCASILRC